jgi:hypothetical protein
VNAPTQASFIDQQRRDEEPGEDEEDVDAEQPTRDPGDAGVVKDHPDDGQRTQAVQCRDMPGLGPRVRGGPSGDVDAGDWRGRYGQR